MNKSNSLSFLLGVALCIGCILFISATNGEPRNEIGRYQMSSLGTNGPFVFIMDTTTGETKLCYSYGVGRTEQLGVPFEKMTNK